ncbi:T9SS type A sorting domain-containing protein [Roseivirga sp. E12]|uniref:T9SS type A sorting domain-containing protein n=1 Tax=Roseivirga sp. E12 TaxID=2819237 RepID=UPI001ABC4194|nr:T9SS type A sorting domain-containing protein [Roseivirga sp. E12]MBO3699220.1 T9SS type A sorting domain-containing protein [Roseivirga sp. E12]
MKKRFLTICTVLLVLAVLSLVRYDQKWTFLFEKTQTYSLNLDAPVIVDRQEKEKENPQDRLEFERMQLADPSTGRIPTIIREKEIEFARESLGNSEKIEAVPSAVSGSQSQSNIVIPFENKGPYNIGGRTRALGIDVANENVILAAGISGGVWKTSNQGASWVRTTGLQEHPAVSAIIQDRRSGKTDEWYYSTGENVGNSADAVGAFYYGNGIYKSTDNGDSWDLLLSTAVAGKVGTEVVLTNGTFTTIDELVIDNSNAQGTEIYAAGNGKIIRSADGFSTYDIVLGQNNTGFATCDVTVSSTGVAFATIGNSASGISQHGIFKSDDGITWTNIDPDGLDATYTRIELAIDPSDENIVYAVTDDQLFVLDVANNTWVNRSSNLGVSADPGEGYDSQDGYNMIASVHPGNNNLVFIGGTNLLRSDDAFTTANSTSHIGGYLSDGGNDQSFPSYPNHHPDLHEISFFGSDPNKMLTGSDGGIHLTRDNRATSNDNSPVTWESLNNGYLTSQFSHAAIQEYFLGDNQIVGGMQDNGTWIVFSNDGESDWLELVGGDGAMAAISYNALYASAQDAFMLRAEVVDGSYQNFTRISPSTDSDEFLQVNPYIVNPVNQDQLFVGANGKLYATNDARTNPGEGDWLTIEGSTSTDINGFVSAMAMSIEPEGILYFGTTSGRLYKISDTRDVSVLADLSVLNRSVLPSGFVSSISVDPQDGSKLLISYSNYGVKSIWYSENGGDSWSSVSGNLEENSDGSGAGPSIRDLATLPDGFGGNYYFAATSVGLFMTQTLDGDNTVWEQQAIDQVGNVVVASVEVRPIDGAVVAATHGNGVFKGFYQVGINPNINFSKGTQPGTAVLRGNVSFVQGRGLAYQWIRNGVPIVGASVSEFTVTQNGDYKLRMAVQGVNGVGESNVISFNFDVVPPEVSSIARLNPADLNTSASSVQFRVTFSEKVVNVSADDFTVSGDVTGEITSVVANGDGLFYDITVSNISGKGALNLTVNSSTNITDIQGNGLTGSAGSVESYNIIDDTAPTATITKRNPTSQIANSTEVTFLVLFSESVQNIDLADFQLTNGSPAGTLSRLTEVSTGGYELVVSNILSNGTLGLAFSSAQDIQDIAGNDFGGTALASESYIINNDIEAPTAVISRFDPLTQVTDQSQVTFLILFSEAVKNVSLGDFTLLQGSVSATFSGVEEVGIGSYQLSLTNISGNGTLSIDFNNTQDIEDNAGNFFDGNPIAVESYIIETDVVAPTAVITRLDPLSETTDQDQVTFQVLFSEDVQNVGLDDFGFISGSPSATLNTITEIERGRYELLITDIDANGTLGIEFSSSQDIVDNGGNAFGGSASASETYIIEADIVAPTATISRLDPLSATTDRQQVTFLILFSEAVQHVDLNDFVKTPGSLTATLSSVTEVDRGRYELLVTGIGPNGTLGIDFSDSQNIQDNKGNAFDGNATSTESYTLETDVTGPTVTISRLDPEGQVTDRDQVTFKVLFSEEVDNVDITDFELLANSPVAVLSELIDTDGMSFELTVDNILSNGTLGVQFISNQDIEDRAGNDFDGSIAANETYSIEADVTAPTAVIARLNPSDQVTDQNEVTFFILFSETVKNVSLNDFVLTEGSLSATLSSLEEVSTGGYELVVSNISGSGMLGIDFASSQNIEDNAGNEFGGTALAKETYTIENDTTAPTAVISRLDPLTENTDRDQVTFQILFSEAVQNVDLTDFVFTSGSPTATLNRVTELDRGQYELLVTGISANGTLGIDFSGAQDIVDNGGNAFDGNATAKESYTIQSDMTPPTVVVTRHDPTVQTTNLTQVTFEVLFSEAVRNVDVTDFVLRAGSPSATISNVTETGVGKYELSISSINGEGTLGIDFTSGQNIEDNANNSFDGNITSNETYNIVAESGDVSGPIAFVTRVNPSSEITNKNQVTFQVLFSESVKNVDLSDFTFLEGSPTASLSSVSEVALGRYELVVSNIQSNGVLGIDFRSSQDIEDDAGNRFDGNIASNQTYIIASGDDVTAPTAVITRRNPSDQFTDQNRVVFQIIFSEAVQNVDLTDLVLADGSPDAIIESLSSLGVGVFEVTINDIVSDGTLGIDFARSQDIQDIIGNRFGGNAIARETYTIQNLVTSIDDELLGDQQRIIVDANPSTGIFNLAFPTYFQGSFEIKVIDLAGNAIHAEQIESYVNEEQVRLDLSKHPDGLYILNASNGLRSASIKLLKKGQ